LKFLRSDARNKPFLDFNGLIAEGKNPNGAFVYDDRALANIIRGNPKADNPKDKGHFHEVSVEFWFIMEGQIEYKIGSLPIFLADQGDIVYVPKGMWHRAHWAGKGTSTRLAMNGYPEMLHNYQPNDELRWFQTATSSHSLDKLAAAVKAPLDSECDDRASSSVTPFCFRISMRRAIDGSCSSRRNASHK
jgi:hypothetical protein